MCWRTDDICGQFQRYGSVFSEALLDVLDMIVEINDDMHHNRASSLINDKIEKTKQLLDKVVIKGDL